MKNFILLFLLAALFHFPSMSQDAGQYRPGEIIVRLTDGADVELFLAKLNRLTGASANLTVKKTIVAAWNIHLIGFDETYSSPMRLLDAAATIPEVMFSQWNNKLEERSTTPDDTDWFQQSDMELINAPDAWDASTGGTTLNGDTIVIAILEKGALLTHPDLAPNRWWNWGEQPPFDKDGIDNDGNGYIDDFGGWNPSNESDDTGNNGWHGTGVYGVIGAKGNNAMGVTGVNWDVKMMNISGIEYVEDILAGYYYAFHMRQLYNESNGTKGAFVVATNASFGYDNQFPTANNDYRTWCSLYDSLGRVGVLSTGATTNSNTDVDMFGDMPTYCGSEFLITVNNVNVLGSRVSSGYGKVSIDLSAPGNGTYTTNVSGAGNTPSYSSQLGGTSGATPHVTGSIGLLYSLGCEGFTSDALTDPDACARRVRDAILDNTAPSSELTDITVTGGVLDLKRAIIGVTKLCDGVVGPLEVLKVRTETVGQEVRLYYQTPIFLPYQFRVFNMLGQLIHEEELNPQQFYENYVKYDFSDLPRAVYVLTISRGNAIVSVKFPKI